MANLNENIDLIERFFEDSLSETEKQLVQEKLLSDPEFSKAFQMEKDLVEGLQASGDIALRKRLDQIHDNRIESQTITNSVKRVHLARRIRMFAAVLLVAIVAGLIIWQLNRASFEERTFFAYYETPSFEDLNRGGFDRKPNPNVEVLIEASKNKFDNQNFQDALIDLNNVLTLEPKNENALLMKGISLLEIGDFPGAEQSFKTIPPSSDQYDSAIWYLGLSYLKQNKLKAAKAEFQKLTDGKIPTGPKRKVKARELVNVLN